MMDMFFQAKCDKLSPIIFTINFQIEPLKTEKTEPLRGGTCVEGGADNVAFKSGTQ